MNQNIYNLIKREYERRQREAAISLDARKGEVYASVPGLEEIDSGIQKLGIKYNKMILLGSKSSVEMAEELISKLDELRKEKARLLSESGFHPGYLDMAYTCMKCKDTGYIEAGGKTEKCTCHRQQLINYLFDHSNLKLAEKDNFSTFNEEYYPDVMDEAKYAIKTSPRENMLRIRERCMKFIENFSSPEERNLFFSGPTGVGKTFICSCIARELLSRGTTVLYQTAPVLFDIISEYKMKAHKEEEFLDSNYKNLFEVELLIIDDLGTEPQSASRYAELLNILNVRQINNGTRPCKTIISTNIDAKELYAYYTERVASRIIGCFDMYKFAGEDIRRIKKSGRK